MVSLKFFGGIQEIGGNKILLEEKDTSILLDFGMGFREYGHYFEEYLKPRTANGFGDYLELGLIPWIEGVYRKDLLNIQGVKPHEEPAVKGVLLSHMHLDHAAFVSFLDQRIPVYCSRPSGAIAQALTECGQRSLHTEIYDFKERPLLNTRCSSTCREFDFMNPEEEYTIGDVQVKAFSVDHSIPGSFAYLVHAPGGTVLYTGDLRLHGTHGDLTRHFIEKMSGEDIDVMVCEGTNIDSEEKTTEEEVEQNCSDAVSKASQLVVADFACKDLARLNTFLKVARENERKLVICFKDAHLYQLLHGFVSDVPSISDEDILLFRPKKGSGLYRSQDYDKWERTFLNLANTVDAGYIRENQDKVVLCAGFYDMNHLIDMKPNPGSIYVHSSSEAFNEEMRIDEERLANWLDYFGMGKYHFHASGHAGHSDLKEIVEKVDPEKLIPIHTENPESFKKMSVDVILAGKGGKIEV